jgi:hypothetical protein
MTEEHAQGCKLYEILALNDKGMKEGLEGPSIARVLLTCFKKTSMIIARKRVGV